MQYWEGKIVNLRAMEPSDAVVIFDWHKDSELGRYMDFLTPPQSVESLKEYATKMSLRKLEDDQFFWMIDDKEGNTVGHIDTRCNVRHGNFEYGVSISSKYKRKGYAAEAIMMIVDYYFLHLRYHKVTAGIHSDNEASIRLHESLGFTLEGRVREMVFTNGKYVDDLYYGLTFEEYKSKKT
jgi:RimJ/RimL family protein N-acetyltransferase